MVARQVKNGADMTLIICLAAVLRRRPTDFPAAGARPCPSLGHQIYWVPGPAGAASMRAWPVTTSCARAGANRPTASVSQAPNLPEGTSTTCQKAGDLTNLPEGRRPNQPARRQKTSPTCQKAGDFNNLPASRRLQNLPEGRRPHQPASRQETSPCPTLCAHTLHYTAQHSTALKKTADGRVDISQETLCMTLARYSRLTPATNPASDTIDPDTAAQFNLRQDSLHCAHYTLYCTHYTLYSCCYLLDTTDPVPSALPRTGPDCLAGKQLAGEYCRLQVTSPLYRVQSAVCSRWSYICSL